MILPCLSYAGLQVCMDSHWTPQNLSTLIRTRTKYKSRLQWPTFIMIRLVGRVLAVAWSAPAPRPPPAIGVEVQPTMQYLGTHLIFHCEVNTQITNYSAWKNTDDLSLLNNLSAKIVNLPPNWRHLRLFLPSSTPPTVSYTSCTPL